MNAAGGVRSGARVRLVVDGVDREGYVRCPLARDTSLAVVHIDRLRRIVLVPWSQLREAED